MSVSPQVTGLITNSVSSTTQFIVILKIGIRVVGKASWKEREVEKFEVGKSEVGKFGRSWKEPSEVGKFIESFQV